MRNNKALSISLIVASLVLALSYFMTANKNAISPPGKLLNNTSTPVIVLKKIPQPTTITRPVTEQQDPLADAVDERFADKPGIQKAWVSRGQNIVLKNYPDADSANFRNTFFHRGFKDRAVTCGKVQFLANGHIIDDYQRFIYAGVQSSYLETDIPNFDLLWDKLCAQTYD